MPSDTATDRVAHDRADRRFVVLLEGHEARLEYDPVEGGLDLTHTLVPDAIGGRGVAGQLVRAALEFARAQGLRVRPSCSYVEAWMRRHPEYDDLRI
ncbi:GNAT family N-acetyltransferase [Cognatiluteimonas weifangensis]|uniref:N-acetyltransferase n=1 Tax=Cognatiluteimonas weifangensis TaxID=2303539 RepID=A0A372DH82_9GAMM|nr:GNAT family N-acetyltransferase [Luteimonas weifangensis]RFP58041.1 N-acetyltransferase [Luteimonas weifangensis]